LQKELAGKIFHDPISKRWETQDEYLSGNVRQKLRDAEFAAREHSEYAGNVEALKAVQPPWKEPGKIKASLGATWIPDADYAQFAQEVLKAEHPAAGLTDRRICSPAGSQFPGQRSRQPHRIRDALFHRDGPV
jgi:N12 class adenine-specific DNA methylase